MSTAQTSSRAPWPDEKFSPWRVVAFAFASLLLHLGAVAFLKTRPLKATPLAPPPLEVVMFEVEPPPPPPVEEVKPEPEPTLRVASTKVKPKARPKVEAPPPPNEEVEQEEPKKAPVVVGLSMSSTTNAGTFDAPVGNTSYGKMAETAPPPTDVKPYSAPQYMPIYQVDRAPQVASEIKIPYPEEARRAGIEGTVTLRITVDAGGIVTSAEVLKGPGHGLNEAAQKAILKFKFHPATKDGQAVSTEMKYSYTFLLD